MGINANQLRQLVVRPALKAIGLWSEAAENLVMGTAAQESGLTHIHQLGAGPAVGLFQMEPATYHDIWNRWLAGQPEIRKKLLKIAGLPEDSIGEPDVNLMAGNLYFAAAMCRIFYRRIQAPLPAADDVPGLAAYWKKYYNTAKGKGTPQQFVSNWSLVA